MLARPSGLDLMTTTTMTAPGEKKKKMMPAAAAFLTARPRLLFNLLPENTVSRVVSGPVVSFAVVVDHEERAVGRAVACWLLTLE